VEKEAHEEAKEEKEEDEGKVQVDLRNNCGTGGLMSFLLAS